MADRINYKELCERVFDTEEIFSNILVFTGKEEEDCPVFRVVTATEPAKYENMSTGKVFWGIVGYDPKTEESQWYNYNHCVSLENFDVLRRLLAGRRYGWMRRTNGLTEEVILLAKAQLREGK